MKKTAMITGSTSGIGLAIAKSFADRGYNLIFHGLEEEGATIAKEVATAAQVDYLHFTTDLRNADEVKAMAESCLGAFENIDVLVNNAGIQFVRPVEDMPLEKWNELFAVHVNAAFVLVKALLPAMKKKQMGRIVNMASAHGLIASPYKSAYIAAKHALIGLTKAVATEGAPYRITSNAVCPGYVLTPLVEAQIPAQMQVHQLSKKEVIEQVFLKDHLIKDFVTPQAVAAAVLFLADSEAAPFITGTTLSIDAGWTAH
ncbi:MAG: 3-hydroxybutyrate dehydrogenase [Spirosomataceae bacterium]